MTAPIDMPEYAWRAELLAKVMFTRRADLAVTHAAGPWDLMVELLDGDRSTGQVFAVGVKATLRPEGFGSAAAGEIALRREWIEQIESDATRARDTPFPVCVVGFAMTTDEGHYAWIRSPVRDGSGTGLVTEYPEHLLPFTDEAIDAIVTRVRAWYRQRRPQAAAG